MSRMAVTQRDRFDDLMDRLAGRFRVSPDALIPYFDHAALLSSLLGYLGGAGEELYVAGYASPQIALAADRAGMKLIEERGASPFVSHPEDLLEGIKDKTSVVYLANPNWVTGANYSYHNLKLIAEQLCNGRLILDEKYYDFFGITGLPLLEYFNQVVVIRSLTDPNSPDGGDLGCLIGPPSFVVGFRQVYDWLRMPLTSLRRFDDCLGRRKQVENRLALAHKESLRVATALIEGGVQNRLTSADFLLLRVAAPRQVSDHLAAAGITVKNLGHFADLDNYLSYQIQSPEINDTFLTVMRRLPLELYHMPDIDKRAIMFHRVERPARTRSHERGVPDTSGAVETC